MFQRHTVEKKYTAQLTTLKLWNFSGIKQHNGFKYKVLSELKMARTNTTIAIYPICII